MELNYKLIYNKLQAKYPEIAKELIPENPILDNLQMLAVFTAFCRTKGIVTFSMPIEEKRYTRDLFVGVFVRFFDPDYLDGYKKKLRKGLRAKMASLIGGQERRISYNLKNVKDYMKIYKDFREEVEHIYKRVKTEVNEKERQREEVNP